MLNPALRTVLLTLVAAMCLPVIAQTYPSKPVKVVVGCAANALAVLPHVESAKLNVLVVLSPTRSPIFPEVPTMAESGFPGFEASVWYGLVAPAATPKPIVQKRHAEVQKALQTAQVLERMTAVGGEVVPGSTKIFANLIHS